ncbi:glycogen-binding subunit 76A isoform X2 [Orussus abietinus]|uniref:glycogen-binding subunit 76A isoform X2 n=1 Tax=Orussus abietinus TaxID=222816 RepID=UPI0006269C9C|nr:glycogen-binding subunit 76A isoform X2 [Orussus abietinus]
MCLRGRANASPGRREAEPSTGSPPSAQTAEGGPVAAMGSTDSAGGAGGGGSSCGLVSSLFPSSCRGRAEAFARRLHRRLTSLGGDEAPRKQPRATETSWLQGPGTSPKPPGPQRNHVLERQPRHSLDSDLCFDFDLEEKNGPGSPPEEVSDSELPDLLVNPRTLKTGHHEACHCSLGCAKPPDRNRDPESGCFFCSPVTGTPPGSDSSETYFDPESSDVERSESYFDPIATSESEVSSLSNGELRGHERGPSRCQPKVAEEAPRIVTEAPRQVERVAKSSSEESCNGRSSMDTTSPSHESLWSTFDESTASSQEEKPRQRPERSHLGDGLRCLVMKSHSDSELPKIVAKERPLEGKPDTEEVEEILEIEDVDEVDFVNGYSESSLSSAEEATAKNYVIVVEEPEDSPRAVDEFREVAKILPPRSTQELGLDEPANSSSDTDTDHSTYSSTVNIPCALTLECPTGTRIQLEETLKNEVQLQIKDGTVTNGDTGEDVVDEKIAGLLKRLGAEEAEVEVKPETNGELEEDRLDRPQRLRRCSSLKTGKTPPGTPGRKKIVRFADVLGLDLADVRTFLDEIPRVPNSAYSDLVYDDLSTKEIVVPHVNGHPWTFRNPDTRITLTTGKPDRTLVPLFQQPGGLPNFLDLVRERQVCLENVLVHDPVSLILQGTVRVRNLDFHKSVHIRYTMNQWRNYSDLQATYVPNSCDGFSDKFTFVLYGHALKVGQRLEFAVRFQCKGSQYWDSNSGANYCFQCLPIASPIGYIPITSPAPNAHDWSPMFY